MYMNVPSRSTCFDVDLDVFCGCEPRSIEISKQISMARAGMLSQMKHTRLSIVAVAVFLCLSAIGCARDTTIILVRHAEKGPGQDPDLTPAGEARAQSLVDVVKRSGVSSIYTTQFKRTQQTAAPAATELGLTPVVTPISGTPEAHASAIASDIKARRTGTRVLVVGHSNTVPLIIAELGVANPPSIAESQFDRIFIVTRRKDVTTRIIEAKYGP